MNWWGRGRRRGINRLPAEQEFPYMRLNGKTSRSWPEQVGRLSHPSTPLTVTFRSLIHFELIFECGVRYGPHCIIVHVMSRFSQHDLLKRLSFPQWMVLVLVENSLTMYVRDHLKPLNTCYSYLSSQAKVYIWRKGTIINIYEYISNYVRCYEYIKE